MLYNRSLLAAHLKHSSVYISIPEKEKTPYVDPSYWVFGGIWYCNSLHLILDGGVMTK